MLYVHGNLSGTYQDSKDCITIADLVEQFIQAEVSFDDVLQILKERKIVYAADATMQAMLSDKRSRRPFQISGFFCASDKYPKCF